MSVGARSRTGNRIDVFHIVVNVFRTIDHFGCKRTGNWDEAAFLSRRVMGITRGLLRVLKTDKLGQFDRVIETRVLRNSKEIFRVSYFSEFRSIFAKNTDSFKFDLK